MSKSSEIKKIYEQIALNYIANVDSSPYNALLERPAMLELIGSMIGLDVLDVGCASGFYTASALEAGASSVTAFDHLSVFVEKTQERAPGAKVLIADLACPLSVIPSNCVDLIIASLVLHYLEDWREPLRELARLLRPGGRLVLSISHPMEDLQHSSTGSYFSIERIEEDWPSYGVRMVSFRHSLTEIFESLTQAHLRVKNLVEPKPSSALWAASPDIAETISRTPPFLCIDTQKVDYDFLTES